MNTRTTLRDRLARTELLLAPGVYDGLSALLAEQAGFEALYLSGASLAYTRFGRPDIGLVSFAELRDAVFALRERSALPLIVDADTGFGNALNVQRTVRELERAGADMVQLEDQGFPKRCGHLEGKSVIGAGEMCGKLRAALDARRDASTLVLARTDAAAVEGLDAALDRAERYLECGVDALFVEALASVDEMRQACERFAGRVPLLVNLVEGGRTPLLEAQALQAMGFRIAIVPGGTVRAAAFALQAYFANLRASGSTAATRDRMLHLRRLNDVLGTPALLAEGRRYAGPD